MRPKVLLVNPPIHDFSAYDFWLKPYGLLRVAGYLRHQVDFRLFDYLDREHPLLPDAALAGGVEQVRGDPDGPGRDVQLDRDRNEAERDDALARGHGALTPPAVGDHQPRRRGG